MKSLIKLAPFVLLIILSSCVKDEMDISPIDRSQNSEAKHIEGGPIVWSGVWICTEEEDGCIWPEGVVPCWDMTGICMIEIVGANDAANYGLNRSDLPALQYQDSLKTIVKYTTVASKSTVGNQIHYRIASAP